MNQPGPSNGAPAAPPGAGVGAPPVPPRPFDPNSAMANPMMGGMGSMGYGGMGYGGYGGYGGGYGGLHGGGMYGMYGGGQMYGQYGGGYGGVGESNFARLAEESSRGAFQSIESVVTAVSSVANMLNSTHNAVYSSFRAVIGVVEQFGRLRTQLSGLVISLSIYKLACRIWRNLMVFLRLKPANYASAAETAWEGVKQPYGSEILGGAGPAAVNWPAMMFWIVALGGPYLIYKCISQMVKDAEEKRKWATGNHDHYTAQALFDFQASNEQELSVMNGDTLRVAPKEEQPRVRGWLLASSQDGSRIGLVPINYVKIVGKKSQSPPLVKESMEQFEKAFR